MSNQAEHFQRYSQRGNEGFECSCPNLHLMICHSRKCHRPRTSSCYRNSEVEHDTGCLRHATRIRTSFFCPSCWASCLGVQFVITSGCVSGTLVTVFHLAVIVRARGAGPMPPFAMADMTCKDNTDPISQIWYEPRLFLTPLPS